MPRAFLLGLLLATAWGRAGAQATPFADAPIGLAAAFGAERAAARLAAASTPDELSAAARVVLEEDLALFGGDAAGDLAAALRDAASAPAAGGNGDAVVALARARADELERVFAGDPARRAALVALLLAGPDGAVDAEGGAGALELERARALWGGLAGAASDDQRYEIEDMFDGLEALRSGPGDLGDDGETAASRLVGFLEGVVGASLAPDLDLGRLGRVLADGVGAACGGEDAGAARAAARLYFEGYLRATAELLAPEASAEVVGALAADGAGGAASCEAAADALDWVAAALGG